MDDLHGAKAVGIANRRLGVVGACLNAGSDKRGVAARVFVAFPRLDFAGVFTLV